MKKIVSVAFFMLLMGAIIFSCSKTSGPQGPAGATGAQGPVGPAGQNGTIIYSGDGVPPASTGNNGDFYIDLSNGYLYGPKTASGWGTPVNLNGATGATGATGAKGATGATGATGAAGTQIRAGATAPSSTLGNVGDYYLDTTNYRLYGPKTSSGWGTPISLQGPTGATGAKGATGPAGPTGPQGPEGNANVIVDTFTVTASADWLYNSQYSFETSPGSYVEYFTRYYDVELSQLTQAFLNTGMVLLYFNPNPLANPNQWTILPYQFLDASGDFYYVMGYQAYVGEIELDYFFQQIVANSTIPVLSNYNIPIYTFRLFLVSSSTVLSMGKDQVNIHDYNQVNRYTGAWLLDKKNNSIN